MKRLSLLKEVRTAWVALDPDNADVRERNGEDLKKKWKKFLKTQRGQEKRRKHERL